MKYVLMEKKENILWIIIKTIAYVELGWLLLAFQTFSVGLFSQRVLVLFVINNSNVDDQNTNKVKLYWWKNTHHQDIFDICICDLQVKSSGADNHDYIYVLFRQNEKQN